MTQKTILSLLIILLTGANLFAQKEPVISIALLANDNIADVNVDQETFIKSFGAITELVKKDFADIDENQKIAILFNFHKVGKPTIEFYAVPKLSNDKEAQFLTEVNSQNLENTKFVDFPILILINADFEKLNSDFKDLATPPTRIYQEYQSADLKKKYELTKNYANEIIPVLCAYQTTVDDQFAGVKNFVTLAAKTDFNLTQDITKLTSYNPDYWRATLEMSLGNQLIPITKIFMLVSQGEFDYALKYIEMIKILKKNLRNWKRQKKRK